MGRIVIGCVLALVFGFGGAAGALTVFHDQFAGAQGQTGLTGSPGPAGERGSAGADGLDGKDGKRGATGKAGKDGKDGADAVSPAGFELGSDSCAGKSVSVITDVDVDSETQKIKLTRKNLCVVESAKQSTGTAKPASTTP